MSQLASTLKQASQKLPLPKEIERMRVPVWLRPILFLVALLAIWEIAVRTHPNLILPGLSLYSPVWKNFFTMVCC